MSLSLVGRDCLTHLDVADNRAKFYLGTVSEEDIAKIYFFLEENLNSLKEGFTVLTDVTHLNGTQEALESIKRVQAMLNGKGRGNTARVIERHISAGSLNSFHGFKLEDGTFNSSMSAECYLNEWRRTKGWS